MAQAINAIRLFRRYRAEQMAELQEEKAKLEAERADSERLKQELLELKAQMFGNMAQSVQQTEPISAPAEQNAEQQENEAPAFIGVLLCLACLVGMTWAWFGVSVQSGSNHISAANYDLEVTVVKGNANTATVTKNDGAYYITLEENVTYQITLKGDGNATIGFGTLTAAESDGAGNAVVYYTKPIATPSATSSENPKTRSFSVKSGQSAQLVIKPVWGEFSPEIFSDENTTYRLVDNQQIYLWGAMAETTLIEDGDSDSGSQQQTSSSSQGAATSSVALQTTETTSAVSSSEPEQNATESVPSSQNTITSEPTVSQEQVTE